MSRSTQNTEMISGSASPEDELARFVTALRLDEVPSDVIEVARQILRTVAGTAVAGAEQDGVPELRMLLTGQGGRAEARSLVFGDELPATSAAQLNATMARALDYCDTMVPGLHLGSSVIPAALVAAEMVGGCTGADLLTGVVAGLEAGAHVNLSEEQYGGFDPTGIAGLFGATATAARNVGLDADQTRNALALSFNRCAGTFQANADASLAVRFIQGFTASNAVQAVQLARIGITGPENFLSGKFGYTRLLGRGEITASSLVADLGQRWDIRGTFFKKFPCCGLAQGPTESALLAATEAGITPETVDRIDVYLPEFAFGLIGHPFRTGSNPQVNAQFNVQYCVTNALVRGAARIEHFEPANVFELAEHPLLVKVAAHHDPRITGHSASRFVVETTDGAQWSRELEVGPGYPGNPLTPADHAHGFADCLGYAPHPVTNAQEARLGDAIDHLENEPDARAIVEAMISAVAPEPSRSMARPGTTGSPR